MVRLSALPPFTHVYVDVENVTDITPDSLLPILESQNGRLSRKTAFLSNKNRRMGDSWQDAGFKLWIGDDGPDAADRGMVTQILNDAFGQHTSAGHDTAKIVIVGGDRMYRGLAYMCCKAGYDVEFIVRRTPSAALEKTGAKITHID